MQQCWRWFGPADTVKIEQLAQVGVEGVVSALHQFPPGEVWPLADILERQAMIAAPHGIGWDVVVLLASSLRHFRGPNVGINVDRRKYIDLVVAVQFDAVGVSFVPMLDNCSLLEISNVRFNNLTDRESEILRDAAGHEPFAEEFVVEVLSDKDESALAFVFGFLPLFLNEPS